LVTGNSTDPLVTTQLPSFPIVMTTIARSYSTGIRKFNSVLKKTSGCKMHPLCSKPLPPLNTKSRAEAKRNFLSLLRLLILCTRACQQCQRQRHCISPKVPKMLVGVVVFHLLILLTTIIVIRIRNRNRQVQKHVVEDILNSGGGEVHPTLMMNYLMHYPLTIHSSIQLTTLSLPSFRMTLHILPHFAGRERMR
jgi:hypothetical protein